MHEQVNLEFASSIVHISSPEYPSVLLDYLNFMFIAYK